MTGNLETSTLEYDKLFIGGRWVEPSTADRIEVRSPATGELVGVVPLAAQADVDAACETARQAFDHGHWPSMSPHERQPVLGKAAALMAERAETFKQLLALVGIAAGFIAAVAALNVTPGSYWSALSTRFVQLLDQLHPQTIADLVGTFDRALSGTDAAMRTLQRSTTLLAATVLSRTDAIRQLFNDIQALGGNIDWLGPSLTTGGPQLGQFGKALSDIVQQASALVESRPVADYFTGDALTPFLSNLTAFLNKIGPSAAPLAPVLTPVVTNAVNKAPRLDLSALIDQALHKSYSDACTGRRDPLSRTATRSPRATNTRKISRRAMPLAHRQSTSTTSKGG
jgi:hypothetical protein